MSPDVGALADAVRYHACRKLATGASPRAADYAYFAVDAVVDSNNFHRRAV
jgi:hypothetical protein